MNVIAKMIATSRMKILTVSKMKKFSADAAGDVGERPRRVYVNQSTAACQGSKTSGLTSCPGMYYRSSASYRIIVNLTSPIILGSIKVERRKDVYSL